MKEISLFILFLTFELFKCNSQELHKNSTKEITIYVVSQGWHSSLIIPNDCIAESSWPPDYPYNQYDHLSIGWGDTDYYQNKGFNFWYATKAAVWPTASTLHLKAFNQMLNIKPLVDDIISLEITKENYINLCRFLQDQFKIDQENKFIPQGPGLYSNSHFFASNEKYSAFSNSNVWTAKALNEAGFDLNPAIYLTQKSLINKARSLSAQ